MHKKITELGYCGSFPPAAPCPSASAMHSIASASRASVRTAGNCLVTPFILR